MAAIATIILGMATQAQAAVPPANVGWLYTTSGSGAVFFDADLSGYPSYEKITVCDNRSDGRGIVAVLAGDYGGQGVVVKDPSNNGNCVSVQGNYFSDGYGVHVQVCEYWSSPTQYANCNHGWGVA
ncbi:hypothetical protein GCM10011608_34660 [Micromonospora sonchi]|uniref:Secreted protein n=1 Tax=Micromonospora sonchi TaxID=1763543 RepID=A0A917U0X4_9ACTN|nr:hypothetical protein [Micromonospora sonchi]GGM46972.1 hypothetical protein GCM10011608_34660 [Micromonospora sonchi]